MIEKNWGVYLSSIASAATYLDVANGQPKHHASMEMETVLVVVTGSMEQFSLLHNLFHSLQISFALMILCALDDIVAV